MVFSLSGADQVAQSVRHGCHFAQVGWEGIRMFPAFAETNSGGRLFYWNLDGSVGLRGANRFDDVMFVQWCLYKAAKWDGLDRVAKVTAGNITGPSIREAFAKTNVNGSCNGLKTDNLVEKITFLQSLILGGYGWPGRPDDEFSAVHNLYREQRRLFNHEVESNSQRGPPARISAARPHAGVRVAYLG
jgi:hypothetical protein